MKWSLVPLMNVCIYWFTELLLLKSTFCARRPLDIVYGLCSQGCANNTHSNVYLALILWKVDFLFLSFPSLIYMSLHCLVYHSNVYLFFSSNNEKSFKNINLVCKVIQKWWWWWYLCLYMVFEIINSVLITKGTTQFKQFFKWVDYLSNLTHFKR